MKSPKPRKNHNNATLTIRLPEAILAQLTTIADAQYKTASVAVREEIIKYIQQNAIFLTAQHPQQNQPVKKYTGSIGGVPIADIMAKRSTPQAPSTQVGDQQFQDDWL